MFPAKFSQVPEQQRCQNAPQLVPSLTERLQAPLWFVLFAWQLPEPQVRVVIVRERVPVVSQAFEYPPHAPQAPVVVEPQVVPLVLREQLWL